MNTERKLETLGTAAQFDLCGACLNPKNDPKAHRQKGHMDRWVYPAAMPDGKTILLFKVLMANRCENNCLYCVARKGNDQPVLSFEPEELARLFIEMLVKRLVEGLFLSSAILGNAQRMMDKMLATVELLRFRYRFPGYVHLKVLPGSRMDQIERAVQLATRVSVNLEAPSPERLSLIAPDKRYAEDLFKQILVMHKLITKFNEGIKGIPPRGQTTQFIVGAAGESDAEILGITNTLYGKLNLSRVFFSAFQPAEGTPFDSRKPTPLLREHRLYQTDFLFRRYGFKPEEVGLTQEGNLPLSKDPKTIWADAHPEFFPLEINTAPEHALLRVPGLGPKTIRKVLKIRRYHKFRSIEELANLGMRTRISSGYLLLNGRLASSRYTQKEIWQPEKIVFGKITEAPLPNLP
ncbi:putative DNA modification/repair radical SAM protein [bacterium]|nr:putative DNA modification/repair radical SAM protein [bacterium]